MILYIIAPCYNEEEIIQESARQLREYLTDMIKENIVSCESRIVFVNDGSTDNTLHLLKKIKKTSKLYSIVSFSRNFGHQYAVLAGYNFAKDKCDAAVSIDADLQQDIHAIRNFIDKFNEGNEVVYGVRNDRNTDGFFKKTTSQLFYRIMKLLGCSIIPNHADYRLLSNKALRELEHFNENSVFLRGLIPTLGLKSDVVYFDVYDRIAGSSKYTMKKMLSLAIDGITAFSYRLIHGILLLAIISILVAIVVGIIRLIWDRSDMVSLLVSISLFFSGVLEMCIWLVGLYVGKQHLESKARPRYIIEEVLHEDK